VIGQTDMLRGGRGHDHHPINAAYLIAACTGVLGILTLLAGIVFSNAVIVTVGFSTLASAAFILQDAVRFRCFRMQRSEWALISDVIVVVAAVSGLYVLDRVGVGADFAILVWAAATLIGFVAVAGPLRYFPRKSEGIRWLIANRDISYPGTGEYLLQAGLPYLLNWVVLALGGYAALAGYRLIQLLFAAVSNMAQGLNAVTLPRVVNTRKASFAMRTTRYEAIVVVACSICIFVALLLLPQSWGVALFGTSWLALGAYLVAGSLQGTVNALAVPNYSLLRLLGFAHFSFIVRVWSVVAIVGLAALGGASLGAPGIAWGIALGASGAYVARILKTRAELRRVVASGDKIHDRRLPDDPQQVWS
jgi:O-antigen/teichoic acid export membrane protein